MKGIFEILKWIFGILSGGAWLVFVVLIAVGKIPDISQFFGTVPDPELLRGVGLFVLGIGVAPLGLYLAYNRTDSLKHQTETEQEKAVTEAFAKAVELLGNQREATRQGGVYALGRLADSYSDLHPMIMDIVASYIRLESSHWFKSEQEKGGEDKTVDDVIKQLHQRGMPMDIEAAVAVIQKRKVKNDKKPVKGEYLLDLSNAYIFNANFSHARLIKVNFSNSVMAHCIFDEADLSDSNCKGSNFEGSSITQEQVDSLDAFDKETVLPEGLSLPAR